MALYNLNGLIIIAFLLNLLYFSSINGSSKCQNQKKRIIGYYFSPDNLSKPLNHEQVNMLTHIIFVCHKCTFLILHGPIYYDYDSVGSENFFEMEKINNINVMIKIENELILTALNKDFEEVVQRICLIFQKNTWLDGIELDLYLYHFENSREIADGLKYLKTENIVHGNLHMKNCLVFEYSSENENNFIVKLTDYSQMNFIVQADFYKQLMERNLNKFIAPEVLSKQKFSFASDVWSFGSILYCLFSQEELNKLISQRNAREENEASSSSEITNNNIFPSTFPIAIETLVVRCWMHFQQHRIDIVDAYNYLLQLDMNDLINKMEINGDDLANIDPTMELDIDQEEFLDAISHSGSIMDLDRYFGGEIDDLEDLEENAPLPAPSTNFFEQGQVYAYPQDGHPGFQVPPCPNDNPAGQSGPMSLSGPSRQLGNSGESRMPWQEGNLMEDNEGILPKILNFVNFLVPAIQRSPESRGQSGMPGHNGQPGMPGHNGQPGMPEHNGQPGMPGHNGQPGMPGHNGQPGMPGHNGQPGMPGHNGQPGMPGHNGQPGMPGHNGQPGMPGHNGQPGMPGHNGQPGMPGHNGQPGMLGHNGQPGMLGHNGQPGMPGHNGQPGMPGHNGQPGMPGHNGQPGMLGHNGQPGMPGHNGQPGMPGHNGQPDMLNTPPPTFFVPTPSSTVFGSPPSSTVSLPKIPQILNEDAVGCSSHILEMEQTRISPNQPQMLSSDQIEIQLFEDKMTQLRHSIIDQILPQIPDSCPNPTPDDKNEAGRLELLTEIVTNFDRIFVQLEPIKIELNVQLQNWIVEQKNFSFGSHDRRGIRHMEELRIIINENHRKFAELLEKCLQKIENLTNGKENLPEKLAIIKQKFFRFTEEFLYNSMIISQQPPSYVERVQDRVKSSLYIFPVEIAALGFDTFLNGENDNIEIMGSIIQLDHSNNQWTCQTSQYFLMKQLQYEYKNSKGFISGRFNVKITSSGIKIGRKKAEQHWPDQPHFLQFNVKIKCLKYGLKLQCQLNSLKFCVVTNKNLEVEAKAFLLRAFSTEDGNEYRQFVHQNEMEDALDYKFNSILSSPVSHSKQIRSCNSERQLDRTMKSHLSQMLEMENGLIMTEKFLEKEIVDELKKESILFYEWFFGIAAEFIKEDNLMLKMWNKGLIYGFCSDEKATELIMGKQYPVILIRFSNSEPKSVSFTIRDVHNSTKVKHYGSSFKNAISVVKELILFNRLYGVEYIYPRFNIQNQILNLGDPECTNLFMNYQGALESSALAQNYLRNKRPAASIYFRMRGYLSHLQHQIGNTFH